jgi:3-oxoacyl-[acyl-carrier-protein] synthase-3
MSPISVAFTEERVAAIVSRGNRIVPEMVREACALGELRPRDIDLLITNQPNPIFLRNWREALELPPEAQHDTYDKYGNLFGAAIPINIEDALANGKLRAGALLGLGGFSHAGDYAAAALIHWQAGAESVPG